MAIQNTAATMPSRAFLVQQATLTAFCDRYPASIRIYGRKEWAEKLSQQISEDWDEGREFCAYVRLEFNALVRRHASLGRRAA